MRMALPGYWSPLAGTLMARRPEIHLEAQGPAFGKQVRPGVFLVGVGDGNRTRTVGLGIGLSYLVDHPAAGGGI